MAHKLTHTQNVALHRIPTTLNYAPTPTLNPSKQMTLPPSSTSGATEVKHSEKRKEGIRATGVWGWDVAMLLWEQHQPRVEKKKAHMAHATMFIVR